MVALSVKLTFCIPHAVSLKDKRQVCRSLAHARWSLEEIIRYMKEHADADLIKVEE